MNGKFTSGTRAVQKGAVTVAAVAASPTRHHSDSLPISLASFRSTSNVLKCVQPKSSHDSSKVPLSEFEFQNSS